MDTIKIEADGVKIIAHRGLSGIERENTCSAFVAACNRSYFGVETDVHITKDGKFVLIHDETTERVSLGVHNINVEESNYSDITDIVLPDLNMETERRDIRIPLLSDYINICKKYNKTCVLEVKNHFSEEDIKKLTEEIKRLDYIENMIFISFDVENCIKLRKILPENTIQWLVGDMDFSDEMIDKLAEHRLDIDIAYKRVTGEAVDYWHSRGLKVNCWTCDTKEDAENLVKAGVDFITTNILE